MIGLFSILGTLIVLVIIAGLVFVNTSPQFGAQPTGEDVKRLKQSKNYQEGKFVNQIPTQQGDILEALGKLPQMFTNNGKSPVDTVPTDFETHLFTNTDSLTHITWFGHSAFLIETAGQRILIDPMLSEIASPLPFGSKRFLNQEAIPIDQLKNIDLLIISHDHYDHLDYATINALKSEIKQFVTPLGVGSHLRSWGVNKDQITELDWWQSTEKGKVKLVACPSRHFSGRGLTDGNSTQWASWIIQSDTHKIYFSGDGGYGPHFKEIGEKYGPFDFAMLECGQYNESWADIHMMPEESAQAGIDVQAKMAMPIHWGAFQLALHSWKDPVIRFSNKASELGLSSTFPEIGQRITLNTEYPNQHWWQKLR